MIKYVIATPDKKQFYQIVGYELNSSGFGGSSSTEYEYYLVDNLEEASLYVKDPTSIMQRYDRKYWKPFVILKVRETITHEIIG